MNTIHEKIVTLQSVLQDRVHAARPDYCVDVTQSDAVGRIDVDVWRDDESADHESMRIVVWATAQTEAVAAVVVAAVRALP